MSAAANLPAGWCVHAYRRSAKKSVLNRAWFVTLLCSPSHPTSNLSPHQY
jgi:hypothetical protein